MWIMVSLVLYSRVMVIKMGCFHPRKAWPIGFHHTGSVKYRITSFTTDHVKDATGDPIEIPCGRCIGCRLTYSRQWADRCMLELKQHEQSWFVTLTYDNDHIDHLKRDVVDPDTGEIFNTLSLNKRDFQLFMKRLRKRYPYDNHLKYFAAGEYGDNTYRPHFHVILFGLKLDDLTFYKQCDGYTLYNSKFLSDCWQNQGHVVVGRVNWDTCAYTARYIMKKQYGMAADIYDRYNIEPEFTLMSRKPAIGREFYDDNKEEIFKYEEIYIGTEEGSHAVRPPRYYEKLFALDFPEDYAILKEQRKEFCDDMKQLKLERTCLPYLEMLETQELVKQSQISALKRKEF